MDKILFELFTYFTVPNIHVTLVY